MQRPLGNAEEPGSSEYGAPGCNGPQEIVIELCIGGYGLADQIRFGVTGWPHKLSPQLVDQPRWQGHARPQAEPGQPLPGRKVHGLGDCIQAREHQAPRAGRRIALNDEVTTTIRQHGDRAVGAGHVVPSRQDGTTF